MVRLCGGGVSQCPQVYFSYQVSDPIYKRLPFNLVTRSKAQTFHAVILESGVPYMDF